jgi:hypothetical protein
VFVLLAINIVFYVLSDLILHIAELVVTSNKFYRPSDSRMSVERIVVITSYNLIF